MIVYDNGPQFQIRFKTLAMVLQDATREDVMDYCSRRKIEWKFITPFSPWSGNVCERFVVLTKSILRKAVGRRLTLEKDIKTLEAEVEAVINFRSKH